MKSPFLVATNLLLAGSTLSMTQVPYSDILTEDDYRVQWQEFSMHRPALTAPLDGITPYWESFNQWLCFPGGEVEMTCLEDDYNGIVWVPALRVKQNDQYYEFVMNQPQNPDCELVKRRWHELIDGEQEFCVYAAEPQDPAAVLSEAEAKTGVDWTIDRLKSRKGYWSFTADENWKVPESFSDEAGEDMLQAVSYFDFSLPMSDQNC